jgi:hypothetical protein
MSAFGWSLESGDRFCVGAFSKNVASERVEMPLHSVYLIRTFYKFYAIRVDSDEINFRTITVQHMACDTAVAWTSSLH